MLGKWVRSFEASRMNLHDEERSGRPLINIQNVVQNVDRKVSIYDFVDI